MLRFKPVLIGAAALFAVSCHDTVLAQDAAEPQIIGEWHGELRTPTGGTVLVLYVEEDENGALTAKVENANQAPGNFAPIDTISVEAGQLNWAIERIGASYVGDWVAEEGNWQGTFNQGMELSLTFEPGLPPARPVYEGLDGLWEGVVELNGARLRQILRVETGERGTLILYDSPDQMVNGLAPDEVTVEGKDVSLSFLGGMSLMEGVLSEDGSELTGEISSSVNDIIVPFTLVRTSETAQRAELSRPQNPEPPFPYTEEEVAFDNLLQSGVHLAGTLTIPEGEGPFPAAIMITGSGAQDRDEALMGHRPFAVIADHLTRNGIAVLRFDDRGFGESRSETPYDDATSADLATDANAAFAFLRQRSEIDPLKIGFIGHSEGGMIGPIAMADNPYAAYIVMLAGPGTDLGELLATQQRLLGATMGASEEQLDNQAPVMEAMIRAIAEADGVEEGRAAAMAVLTPEAMEQMEIPADFPKEMIVNRLSSPWFQYFLSYDPAPNLARIRAPILALNGSLDLQVPADANLDAIRAATTGNTDVTIVKLDGLNHLFQHAETGGIGEYMSIEETFAPEVLEMMSDWINERFGQ